MPQIHKRQLIELLGRIMNDCPSASREEVTKLYIDRVRSRGYDDYNVAIIRNFVGMNYGLADGARNPPTRAELAARQTAARRRALEQEAADALEVEHQKALILSNLLDFMTPLGKPLRNCTGRECSQIGGFFTRVGENIDPDEIVGEVLSNRDLRSLFNRHRRRTFRDNAHPGH